MKSAWNRQKLNSKQKTQKTRTGTTINSPPIVHADHWSCWYSIIMKKMMMIVVMIIMIILMIIMMIIIVIIMIIIILINWPQHHQCTPMILRWLWSAPVLRQDKYFRWKNEIKAELRWIIFFLLIIQRIWIIEPGENLGGWW